MDKNTLYPIYEMIHVPFWQEKWFYIVLCVAGLLFFFLLLVFAFYFYKKRFTSKGIPVHVEALNELKKLEESLKKDILSKTFYFKLTWILKRYLNGRYGYDVYGKTDSELITFLEKTSLNQELFEKVQLILTGSEVIKFANELAIEERMKADVKRSVEFVKNTMQSKG